MDNTVIERGLSRTSSTAERLDALSEAGFTTNALAKSLGVTRQSLHNWRNNRRSPRPEAALERLDNLRCAMARLVTSKELEPSVAVAWMQSLPNQPPYVRPMDIIAEDPTKVFKMIERESFTS